MIEKRVEKVFELDREIDITDKKARLELSEEAKQIALEIAKQNGWAKIRHVKVLERPNKRTKLWKFKVRGIKYV